MPRRNRNAGTPRPDADQLAADLALLAADLDLLAACQGLIHYLPPGPATCSP